MPAPSFDPDNIDFDRLLASQEDEPTEAEGEGSSDGDAVPPHPKILFWRCGQSQKSRNSKGKTREAESDNTNGNDRQSGT
jgi:hypothetical protein